tara:strand:- start:20 stop:232 length:213 start_codon:yes stop_codon:yes gene_type:complete
MNYLFQALLKKYEGDIEAAKANLKVYERNPAGIGEHPDIIEAMDSQLSKIAEAEDKISVIKKHFEPTKVV